MLAKEVFSIHGLNIIAGDLEEIHPTITKIGPIKNDTKEFAHLFKMICFTSDGLNEVIQKLSKFSWRHELFVDIVPTGNFDDGEYYISVFDTGILREREAALKEMIESMEDGYLYLCEDSDTLLSILYCETLLKANQKEDGLARDVYDVYLVKSHVKAQKQVMMGSHIYNYEKQNKTGNYEFMPRLQRSLLMFLPGLEDQY